MQDKNTFTLNSTEPFSIFVDSDTDNKTGVTGVAAELVANFELRKSGGSFVSIAPTIAEIGHGHYSVTLLASHRDTSGPVVMRTTATGANTIEIQHRIVNPAQIIRDAVGLAAADLDTQLGAKAEPGDAMALTPAERNTTAGVIEAEFLNDLTGDAFMAGIQSKLEAILDEGTDVPVATLVSLQAAAVRTELATELARIDVNVSSRSSHGAPDLSNLDAAVSSRATPANVAAVETKVDTLLSRVTTTVAQLWADLVAMITGSGAEPKFTETALENVSGGGGGLTNQNITDITNGVVTGVTKVAPRIQDSSENIYRLIAGDTWSQQIDVTAPSAERVILAIKHNLSDAIVLIDHIDGLLVLNGADATAQSEDGELTVDPVSITVRLTSERAIEIPLARYHLIVKALETDSDKTWEYDSVLEVYQSGIAAVTTTV